MMVKWLDHELHVLSPDLLCFQHCILCAYQFISVMLQMLHQPNIVFIAKFEAPTKIFPSYIQFNYGFEEKCLNFIFKFN